MPGVALEHQAIAHTRLTDREIDALAALGEGMTLAVADRVLGVSDRTVRRRVQTACERDAVRSLERAADTARRLTGPVTGELSHVCTTLATLKSHFIRWSQDNETGVAEADHSR